MAPTVVYGSGLRAVVTPNPFRLHFENDAGVTILAEVVNSLPAPYVAASVPQGPGSSASPTRSLYAPLSFEVGGGSSVQYPAGPWTGNLLTDGSSGVQYAATAVTASRCTGRSAMLTLATNDPTGRTITLVLAPDASGAAAIAVVADLSSSLGVSAMADSFASDTDEQFHGFGGLHDALSQRGNAVTMWTEQENFGASALSPYVSQAPGTGGDTYLFPNGPTAAYYSQALFVSSRPYGFFLDHTELARFRLADTDATSWQVEVAATALHYVVAAGDGPAAIGALATINGRQRVPPDWALGIELDRGVRVLSANGDTADSYTAAVVDDLAKMDQYGIRPESYRIEGWDFISREQLAGLVQQLKARGIRPLFYIRPFASRDAANTENAQVFTDVVSNGWCAKTAAGACYAFGSPFVVGVAVLIDFTNPDAVKWWNGRIAGMLDLGAEGFMEDFGEQVQTGMLFADGSTGLSMHNRYPVLYHAITRAALDDYQRSHPGVEPFYFTRAGFSGRGGSVVSENANFPGDETTDWDRASGLPSIIPDMLNRGLGGAYGFAADIGGYEDIVSGAVTAELFARWSEAEALMPVFRVHNSASTGVRMPWSFDATTLEIWKSMAALHLRARPLIKRLWQQAQIDGLPVTRPLWLAYPDDAQALAQDQEFLLGADVLVAPVVAQGATARDVYLPSGCWQRRDAASAAVGMPLQGPQTVAAQATLGELPYFFRCGTQPF